MDTTTIRPVPDSSAPSTPAAGSTDPAAALTLTDRCDRCGSRAYVRATLASGSALLFCGHHGNAHRAALSGVGAALHDETDQLTTRRESSAA